MAMDTGGESQESKHAKQGHLKNSKYIEIRLEDLPSLVRPLFSSQSTLTSDRVFGQAMCTDTRPSNGCAWVAFFHHASTSRKL